MRKRYFSFDRTLPDGRVVCVRKPRMTHLRANITYVCDRKCPNCNRACGVAPSSHDEDMRPEDFRKAMEGSVEIGRVWTKLILTGGEPSLHPRMMDFVEAALWYVDHGPNKDCEVHISTYHHPEAFCKVQEALAKYPTVKIMGVAKNKPRIHEYAPYMAPMDDPGVPADNFYNGCHLVGSLCGATMDYRGFYCCPIAAAIARVFDLDVAVKDVKDVTVDSLVEQYDAVCRRCGQYTYQKARGMNEPMSKSWIDAVRAYRAKHQS